MLNLRIPSIHIPYAPQSRTARLHSTTTRAPFPSLNERCDFVRGALSLRQAKARLPQALSLPVSFTKAFAC